MAQNDKFVKDLITESVVIGIGATCTEDLGRQLKISVFMPLDQSIPSTYPVTQMRFIELHLH